MDPLHNDKGQRLWSCGMVAGLIHDIPTCKELIDRVISHYLIQIFIS